MKTVGIFGDSHADCTYLGWQHRNIELGWPELLALKYKVKNFAVGGTGMFYSYDLFKKFHNKFDIIVYVPTQSDRFSLLLPDAGTIRHMVPGFLLAQADRELSQTKHRPNDYKAIEAAIGYSSYILDQDKDKEMKRLMMQEIKHLRPDTIVVPAFQDDTVDASHVSMSHISTLELAHYNVTLTELRKRTRPLLDIRKCHLTSANNRVVFNKVMAAIDSTDPVVRFTESDFVAPPDPFSKYFIDENGRTNI